nr:tail fiber protein [uncultured Haemophilus sp.]
MSKKSWYKRKHQFTPYTKADGQAVSDEFDAIQVSFERIPDMRDDGKGFKESPLIPEPTDPMHPVPLQMLTETEKSVNNARDDVTAKAQQVAQNTQSVAANTLTATQKADTATQAAASAQSSQQAASNSENMAHKWAANPVNAVVQGDQYSAYHYATKAAQSETTATSAAITSKNNADIATSKAEEAIQAANKAKSIADGEVEYAKILHVPSANTQTKGIVLLTNDTGLESESLGLTAKAGKKLAQMIAIVQTSLTKYLLISKLSSSINSTSEDNVATSLAVKNAYDKGVEAKTAADDAQRTANDAQSSANAANNNANGRVSKGGDAINGMLFIDGVNSGGFANGLVIRNKAGGQNTSGFVDFYQSDTVPRSSIWFRDNGNGGTQIEFLNTPEGSDFNRDSRQGAFTISSAGNLWSKTYGLLHDYFAKQADINNVWDELNNHVMKRGDFIRNWYPNHYNGTEVYKIRHLNLMITVMYATGNKELILPEHYDGHFGVWATDRGSGNVTVNGNYPVGNNRVRVGGRDDTAVAVLVIGMKSV